MRLPKLIWVVVLALSSTAQSATYYVSTTGNDANDGLTPTSRKFVPDFSRAKAYHADDSPCKDMGAYGNTKKRQRTDKEVMHQW